MPKINSHNSWSLLEEVWLGDVYPIDWYEHLDSEIRDVFQQITEVTKQDLKVIETLLKDRGVVVRRPHYDTIDKFVDQQGMLKKPEICPRDTFLTVGDTLLTPYHNNPAWRSVLDLYRQHGQKVKPGTTHIINGANVVRLGRDIVIDTDIFDIDPNTVELSVFEDYRIHWEKNGGHMDGCFAVLKPGLVLANHYYDGYDRTLPGWQRIFLDEPTYWSHRRTPPPGSEYNGKFYAEGVTLTRAFNQHVVQHAQDWVGNYTETYFELNCLVLDECNVVMLGYNESLEKTLKSHDITVHWVPFRCRGFWDGGMHCITLDICRQSKIEDFFLKHSRE
jgi:hypothetical protein